MSDNEFFSFEVVEGSDSATLTPEAKYVVGLTDNDDVDIWLYGAYIPSVCHVIGGVCFKAFTKKRFHYSLNSRNGNFENSDKITYSPKDVVGKLTYIDARKDLVKVIDSSANS